MFEIVLNCGYPLSQVFSVKQFLLLSAFILAAFLYFSFSYLKKSRVGILAMVLLIIGGIMNGGERMSSGCVQDYFNFFNLFHFNLADLLIDAGILLSVLVIWKKK